MSEYIRQQGLRNTDPSRGCPQPASNARPFTLPTFGGRTMRSDLKYTTASSGEWRTTAISDLVSCRCAGSWHKIWYHQCSSGLRAGQRSFFIQGVVICCLVCFLISSQAASTAADRGLWDFLFVIIAFLRIWAPVYQDSCKRERSVLLNPSCALATSKSRLDPKLQREFHMKDLGCKTPHLIESTWRLRL